MYQQGFAGVVTGTIMAGCLLLSTSAHADRNPHQAKNVTGEYGLASDCQDAHSQHQAFLEEQAQLHCSLVHRSSLQGFDYRRGRCKGGITKKLDETGDAVFFKVEGDTRYVCRDS